MMLDYLPCVKNIVGESLFCAQDYDAAYKPKKVRKHLLQIYPSIRNHCIVDACAEHDTGSHLLSMES